MSRGAASSFGSGAPDSKRMRIDLRREMANIRDAPVPCPVEGCTAEKQCVICERWRLAGLVPRLEDRCFSCFGYLSTEKKKDWPGREYHIKCWSKLGGPRTAAEKLNAEKLVALRSLGRYSEATELQKSIQARLKADEDRKAEEARNAEEREKKRREDEIEARRKEQKRLVGVDADRIELWLARQGTRDELEQLVSDIHEQRAKMARNW